MNPNAPPQYQPPPPYGVQVTQQTQPGYPPTYGHFQAQPSNVVVISQPGVPRGLGNCPHCGTGYLRTVYTPLGLILCLLFFPLGLICCVMTAEKRCSHCNAAF